MMRRMCSLLLLALMGIRLEAKLEKLEISAEWLYMQLSAGQPEYVINSSQENDAIGERVPTGQNWYSGYRAQGIYGLPAGLGELSVRGTYFPSMVVKDTTSGDNLMGILNHPFGIVKGEQGTARIEDKYNIFFLDLLIHQKVIERPCYSLSLDGGVQFARLGFQENVTYPFGPDFYHIEARSRTKGVGLEIGGEYTYALCRCVHFLGGLHSSALISLMNKSYEDVDTNGVTYASVENDKYWRFAAYVDLRLGLRYSLPISLKRSGWRLNSVLLNGELGYEMISFFGGVERIYFVNGSNAGSSFNEKRTLTLQGPYLQLGVSF